MINTIEISAACNARGDHFRATIRVDDQTFAAMPKSLGFKSKCWGLTINLAANKVNGSKNEGGIKRIRAILKHFPDATFTAGYLNSYKSIDEFKQIHGI